MGLFDVIPERFFSILTSPNKRLYVQALFVLRAAFKTELLIRREDLNAMLISDLEDSLMNADFSADETDAEADQTSVNDNISARMHFLVRKLRDTGWLEIETERGTFEENISIPDYSIAMINLLYDLSTEKVREYNSYVFTTYSALKNVTETPEYAYTALQGAYQNTTRLVDELKTLYNNIRRYNQHVLNETDVNGILAEHFDKYKELVYNAVYYPLKTIDSIPRFKNSILSILDSWLLDDEMIHMLEEQGKMRHAFSEDTDGHEKVLSMINSITDIYDGIEAMIDDIDRKQTEYTRASVEKISYFMNVDQSVKGRLVQVLQHSGNRKLSEAMKESISLVSHGYYDNQSLYARIKRTKRSEGKPLAIHAPKQSEGMVSDFLEAVRRQYTNQKIDEHVLKLMGDSSEITTEEIRIKADDDFIYFLLGTIRGREKSSPYSAEFGEDNIETDGYSLPEVRFIKKVKAQKPQAN